MQTPPDPVVRTGRATCSRLAKLAWNFRAARRRRATPLSRSSPAAARPILDRWFESEQLKVTLATDAIIGAMASPSMPGTAYVLFHHVMGECNGVRGVWGYVRGGMGGITQCPRRRRARIGRGDPLWTRRCRASLIRDGRRAQAWCSPTAPSFTRHAGRVQRRSRTSRFSQLMDARRPADGLRARRCGSIDYRSASLKINVALSELPDFTALLPGARGRAAASRHDPHRADARLHGTRVRRRQVRRAIGIADSRMHDSVGGRSDRRAAGQAPDVDVHPVRAVRAARRQLGRPEGAIRRPLLRHRSPSTRPTSSAP